jgi:hypothetical protein
MGVAFSLTTGCVETDAGAVEAGMDGVAPTLGAIAKYLPEVPMIATIGSKLKERLERSSSREQSKIRSATKRKTKWHRWNFF